MRRQLRFLAAVVATLAPAITIAADTNTDTDLAAASAADFNGDGKVSWEEFRNRVVAVFGHLDSNQDGRIAGDEHPPAVDKSGKAVQPGNVTAESFTASVATAFKASDKDGDGELSSQEWSGTKP